MIVIIDYGVGNLFSLSSSFNQIGYETVISGDAKVISKADKLLRWKPVAFINALLPEMAAAYT